MAYQTSSGNYFTFTRNYNIGELTASIWIYPTSSLSQVTPCGLWEDAGTFQQWIIARNANKTLTLAVFIGATVYAVTSTGTAEENTWTHVALVKRSSALDCYLNGAADGTTSASGSLISRTAATGIGARQAGNQPFPGNVAEFATWTRALSGAEVASLADGFKPSRIPNPDIYYPLVREKIDVRNNYTLTTVGSPAVQPHPRIY
jgi:hypothetical protein